MSVAWPDEFSQFDLNASPKNLKRLKHHLCQLIAVDPGVGRYSRYQFRYRAGSFRALCGLPSNSDFVVASSSVVEATLSADATPWAFEGVIRPSGIAGDRYGRNLSTCTINALDLADRLIR